MGQRVQWDPRGREPKSGRVVPPYHPLCGNAAQPLHPWLASPLA